MQEETLRFKYSALKGPIVFWIAWATIALVAGVVFLLSAIRYGEKGPFWVWGAVVVTLGTATFGYICALRRAYATVSVVFGGEALSIEEHSFKSRLQILRKKDVRAVSVIRLGVDPTEGPDSFPRFGVVVSLEQDFLLVGELPKIEMLKLGQKIADWAGVGNTDLGEQYFWCADIWKRAEAKRGRSMVY